jgi:hypothetical protein
LLDHRGALYSEIVLLQPRNLHKGSQQSSFQRLISVDRNDDPFTPAWHCENVVAAVNAGQCPTVSLDYSCKLATIRY